MRALKQMCGRGVRSFYLAQYDLDHSTPSSRQAFIVPVERVVSRISIVGARERLQASRWDLRVKGDVLAARFAFMAPMPNLPGA